MSEALEETNTHCYAWVLMDNHFHFLLRPLSNPLSKLMRKVLSGYVGYYNARHKRVGHLFQNRYKSILCQEDEYFKELVRYIHLNPVRSKIIQIPSELIKYRWCGHGALVGKNNYCVQDVNEVLSMFGRTKKEAQEYYYNFIKSGWKIGHKKEYNGSGLLKSAGGMSGIRDLKTSNQKWQHDSRILGDGNFVENCLEEYDKKELIRLKIKNKYNMESLGVLVSKKFEIKESDLFSGRRLRSLSLSKGVYIYLASEYTDKTLKEIGMKLKMSSTNSLYFASLKGKEYIEKNGNFLQ